MSFSRSWLFFVTLAVAVSISGVSAKALSVRHNFSGVFESGSGFGLTPTADFEGFIIFDETTTGVSFSLSEFRYTNPIERFSISSGGLTIFDTINNSSAPVSDWTIENNGIFGTSGGRLDFIQISATSEENGFRTSLGINGEIVDASNPQFISSNQLNSRDLIIPNLNLAMLTVSLRQLEILPNSGGDPSEIVISDNRLDGAITTYSGPVVVSEVPLPSSVIFMLTTVGFMFVWRIKKRSDA